MWSVLKAFGGLEGDRSALEYKTIALSDIQRAEPCNVVYNVVYNEQSLKTFCITFFTTTPRNVRLMTYMATV